MIVLNHIFGGMCRVVTIATKKKKKKKNLLEGIVKLLETKKKLES